MRPNALGIASGTLLFVLASYALGVTFTRGAYVSCAGALAVLFVAIAVVWWRGKTWTFGRMAIAAVLVLPGLAILAPIVSGGFMEARVEGTRADALTRTRHWAAAIDMRNAGLTTSLFGMGLGTFPKTALFSGRYPAPATFSFERDRGNGFVRMGSGTAMFLDQRVAIDAGKSYKVALDLRSADPNGRIDVLVCEKSIDYSFRCKETRFAVTTAGTAWEPHESSFDAGQMGSGPWYLRRPVVLSLYNSEPGTVIDIDNVRLTDERGHDLVGNGDFSEGAARWYFSADDHLLFHIKNLWVDVLFKLGWFGVFALAFAVVLALSRLAAAVWNRDFFAAFPLAALCGLLLTGLTESLFDGPRITTLFFLLLFAGLMRPAARQHA